jgi:predicted amidohydrolase
MPLRLACSAFRACSHSVGNRSLNITLSDVVKAGELGVDLAVLPENWPMQESDGGAVTDPPPQPLSGSLITTVAALAKRYSMNIVAPIRELRDGRFFNTAVVIDRSGTIVYVFVLGAFLRLSSFWVAFFLLIVGVV